MAFVIAELSNDLSCVNDVLNTSGTGHSPYPAGGAAAPGSVGTTEPAAENRILSIMYGQDPQFLVPGRGFKADRIAGLAIHQGLSEGRNHTDSALVRFRLIRPNYLVGF